MGFCSHSSFKELCLQDKIHNLFFFLFFTEYICGDKCRGYFNTCTCGGSQLPYDKFCCIPSNASCSGIEDGEVNCPNGTAYDYDQPCGNECSARSAYNTVAISTLLDNYECPKSDRFSKVSSGTKGSKDFKEYCFAGETCGSSTCTVNFKQCYSKM